ncbi:MAG: B12-binding domain-containing radical SAM protein [Pirellulales bacterium]|nr:B12-binding domain-containing radical SAM protein [Pirellulales bacterium]
MSIDSSALHILGPISVVADQTPRTASTPTRHVTLVRPTMVSSAGTWSSPVTPPLGLAYLAAMLREAAFEVECVDAIAESVEQFVQEDGYVYQGLTLEETVERIDPLTDLIGVSCMFSQDWPYVKRLINSIRARFPEKIIVIGGEHVTALPELCLRDCPAVDYCVLGEGEETLVEVARLLDSTEALQKVAGLAYLDRGEYKQTASRARIRAVDSLPMPAWDLFPMEVYLETRNGHGIYLGRTMGVLASRGCPYKCTFCSNPKMYGQLYVPRNPAHVLDEIEHDMKKYGATNFDFYDLTMILKRNWILEFCRLIEERGLKITWQLPTGTRSEVVDDEVAAALFRTGCRNITYAPESGDPETLDIIKKRVHVPCVLESIRASLRNGINVKCNIIIGFPHERRKHVLRTLVFCWRMAIVGVHDVGIFLFSPYPGSQLFNELRSDGIVGELNDDYFQSLVNFMDPTSTVAFSKHVSGRELAFWRGIGMLTFFGLSYLVRPWRFFHFVKSVVTNDSRTVLEQRVSALLQRLRSPAKKSGSREYQGSVATSTR